MDRKRLIIFGPHVAAIDYARRHGYGPSEWIHATEIVGTLTVGNTEALKEWHFRMKR